MTLQIFQIVPHYVPSYRFGGPLRVAHGLACGLINAGHEVTIFTTNLQDETRELNVPLDKPVNVDNAQVYYESVPFLRYWGFSPTLYRRIHKEMPRCDFVLVHAHYQFANWIGAYLARKFNKPYAIFAHSSLHNNAVAHRNQWLKQMYLYFLERQNLRGAKFIAFNAAEEMEQSLFSERGKVIPSGIDLKEFESLPPPGYFYEQYPQLRNKTKFLFLGRLDIQQKGLDLLIAAFAEAILNRDNLHLILAGPDEDNASSILQNLIESYELTQHVTFTGLISGELKKAVLQDADVFLLPSRFEGLSIALLEALYMGLPVIVTDRVGLHKTIQELHAGIVVQPEIRSIAKALIKMSTPEERTSLEGRGVSLVRDQYTWDSIANKLLNMMKAPDVEHSI